MTPARVSQDEFIRLVSAALDDPGDRGLSARIADLAARQPELAPVRQQLETLDRLLRADEPAVAWTRLRAMVTAAVDQAGTPGQDAADFDRDLRYALRLDERVDWAVLQRRIAGAVDRRGRRSVVPVRWRLAGAAGLLAAAAAVALMIIWPAARPGVSTAPLTVPATAGRAFVQVGPPSPAARPAAGTVQVLVLAEPADEPVPPEAAEPDASGGSEPELFLMVEPPAAMLLSAEPAGGA